MGQIGGVDRQVWKQASEMDRKVWGSNLFYLLLNCSSKYQVWRNTDQSGHKIWRYRYFKHLWHITRVRGEIKGGPCPTLKTVFHQKLCQRKLGQSVCRHNQSFFIIFVKELAGRIGGKSCKHEKMASTLTNYENIAVPLCLMRFRLTRGLLTWM
jgi:hypothetical protein